MAWMPIHQPDSATLLQLSFMNWDMVSDSLGQLLAFGGGGADCAGCTDPVACNYSIYDTSNNGSCCFETCVSFAMTDSFGDGWNRATYEIADMDGNSVTSGTLIDDSIGQDFLCLSYGCYSITVGGGPYDSEIGWILNGVDGGSLSGGAPTSLSFSINSTCSSCTDDTACNYDPTASFDDDSCEFLSCTCLGDCNNDGVRETSDLFMLLSDFGCAMGCFTDLTGDEITDTTDLLAFLSVFGTPCP
ncbi:MAG: hypothetical protein ACI84C_000312 [Flavobacteriales bacterium]|jgi:hypothetical protein